MDNKRYPFDSGFDDGVYGTGCTEPPKNHQAIIALLLIAVIFLGGISTALSVLNIRLFQELNQPEEQAVAFSAARQYPAESTEPTAPLRQDASAIAIHTAPDLQVSPEDQALSLQEIYEKNIPSVVSITAQTVGATSTGTGVVLSGKGYLVTNFHVVEGAQNLRVRLSDDREFAAALVGSDPVSDLAVLYIDAEGLTEAQFGDSDSLRVGDSVVAIGDPLGVELRGTMTDGIISAINRDVTVEGRTMSLLQTNAALNSGNSGGPLIDCYGQVVGINTLKIGSFVDRAGVEGLGFAIPSSTVKIIVDQLITQGYVSGRPTLGITGETLSSFYQHYYRMPAGLLITQVDTGSTADRAGVLAGDILLTLGDIAVKDMNTLNALLNRYSIGDTVQITIYRGGRQYSAALTVEEAKK